MKILFLVKFYQPFDRGGSEWSTHDLARLLVKKKHQVTVLTPNYGAKKKEIIDDINIYRMPFPVKLKNLKDKIAPCWTNNIIWFVATSILCLWLVKKEKFELIHVHSNEFLPAAVISSFFLKKSTVATFRDYQVLCNLGFCLWQSNKACNLRNYLIKDFNFFYKYYVDRKNILVFIFLVLAAVRARLMQKILYFFAKRIDFKVAVSKKVAAIFSSNGISNIAVIHNPVIIRAMVLKQSNNEIIYVGRLSKGKGIDLFFDLIPQILKKIPKAVFKLIGSGYLEKRLRKKIKKLNLDSKVELLGQLDHMAVLRKINKAALVVVPSIWPEPLPRSAIETILSATPVVATNVGGIGEIVKNNSYGVLAEPNKQSLQKAIIKGFLKKDQFKKNILEDLEDLKKHFSNDISAAYEEVYTKGLK